MFKYEGKGKEKYFIGFTNRSNTECRVVSIGVGFDFAVETRISNQYPYCKFSVVDPLADVNREIVQRVPGAKLYRAVIGGEDGTYNANLLGKLSLIAITAFLVNDDYKVMNVTHVSVTRFLRKLGTEKIIDLLNIDVEGSEFGILPALISNPSF
jgi:hypothetical protein